ncbi:Gibberellin-regulated protein 12 [Camellia lanceoleosa]|uniref:Gibberellin-regulated protein 12 n=1 Tax=Camellia lanceoleosa TaxID=1840588 RepID=A0ACC0HMH6_9ERIC|nr:Gibberellin-regulated protein 12 [Camellia lanceoleosa]
MAGFSRLQFVFLFFLVAFMSTIQVSLAGGEGSLTKAQCPAACAKRCSATSHLNNCLMFCNLCCDKCLCVPSGTYGHKEECPCYNNWKTKKGGPKCP